LAEAGEPFERVEAAKSALWLLAWSTQDRGVRLRVAKEAIASLENGG
jgi:hypothetical protein